MLVRGRQWLVLSPAVRATLMAELVHGQSVCLLSVGNTTDQLMYELIGVLLRQWGVEVCQSTAAGASRTATRYSIVRRVCESIVSYNRERLSNCNMVGRLFCGVLVDFISCLLFRLALSRRLFSSNAGIARHHH